MLLSVSTDFFNSTYQPSTLNFQLISQHLSQTFNCFISVLQKALNSFSYGYNWLSPHIWHLYSTNNRQSHHDTHTPIYGCSALFTPQLAVNIPYMYLSGFGFVSFVDYANSERAVLELNGRELDSRIIRVEKARRANGYEKTPGRCKINFTPSLKNHLIGRRKRWNRII